MTGLKSMRLRRRLLTVLTAVVVTASPHDDPTVPPLPAVLKPFVNGISLDDPGYPSGAQPLAMSHGLLDVTQPPYSADSTGQLDATAAIQAAVDASRGQYLALYFPVGEYLVNDTIEVRVHCLHRALQIDSSACLLYVPSV